MLGCDDLLQNDHAQLTEGVYCLDLQGSVGPGRMLCQGPADC
jgi:hypothetical protein